VYVLILNNGDPSLGNLLDPLRELGAECDVRPSSSLRLADIRRMEPMPRRILLSHGPGRPEETGACLEVVEQLPGVIPILGIGLGLQAIAHTVRARLVPAKARSEDGGTMRVRHDGRNLFAGLPEFFDAPRDPGTSLLLDPHDPGEQLEVSAWDESGGAVGCRASYLGLEAIQVDTRWFSTRLGNDMLFNFLYQAQAW
jgi:anthranilate/para-aminobenzoate synthase component II